MKKLKLNLQHLDNAEVLTKSQLKNILGGSVVSTTGGQCQEYGEKCSTALHLNCCNTLVCGDFLCEYATLPSK